MDNIERKWSLTEPSQSKSEEVPLTPDECTPYMKASDSNESILTGDPIQNTTGFTSTFTNSTWNNSPDSPYITRNLSFGEALVALEQGSKITRESWFGQAYLWYNSSIKVNELQVYDPHLLEAIQKYGESVSLSPNPKESETCKEIIIEGSIYWKTFNNTIVVGWQPCQTELFARDWCTLK